MYLELENKAIQDFKAVIVVDSKCWSRMHAHCSDGSRRICKWKPKESYISLFELLHEIGHLETDKKGMKRAEQESEATKWQLAKMKECNLPIKRKYLRQYKDYIRMTYDRGIRRGLSKRIKSKLLM